jgi:hypothetical protein
MGAKSGLHVARATKKVHSHSREACPALSNCNASGIFGTWNTFSFQKYKFYYGWGF